MSTASMTTSNSISNTASSTTLFAKSPSFPSRFSQVQNYETLCKVVLTKRLKHMFIITGVIAYLALLLTVFDPRELPGSLFNFLPVLLFAPITFLGAVPVFVLRKQTRRVGASIYPTRLSQLLDLLRLSETFQVLLAYGLGSAAIFTSYVWCTSWVSPNPQVGILFYHVGRDNQQLNERRVYLTLLHCYIVLYMTVDHIISDRSKLEFEATTGENMIAPRIPRRLISKARSEALPRIVRITLVTNSTFYLLYLLMRKTFLRAFILNFAGDWLKPHLYSLVTSRSVVWSSTLVIRASASSILVLATWEAANTCFEVYATQPMLVSQFSSNPNNCLLSGLRASERYYQLFAFNELAVLSLTSPQRRKAIFTDIKASQYSSSGVIHHNGGGRDAPGGAWTDISRECLLLIGNELQRAKGRGGAESRTGSRPETASGSKGGALQSNGPTNISQPQAGSTRGSLIHVNGGNVFQPTKTTVLDRFASTLAGPSPSSPNDHSSSAAHQPQTISKPSSSVSASGLASTFFSTAANLTRRIPPSVKGSIESSKSDVAALVLSKVPGIFQTSSSSSSSNPGTTVNQSSGSGSSKSGSMSNQQGRSPTSSSSPSAASTSSTTRTSSSSATTLLSTLLQILTRKIIPACLPSHIKSRWTLKKGDWLVENYVTRRVEVIWSIQVLSNLMCASLVHSGGRAHLHHPTFPELGNGDGGGVAVPGAQLIQGGVEEDPYGVAQRELTKILEGFVLYLETLEKLRKGIQHQVESPPTRSLDPSGPSDKSKGSSSSSGSMDIGIDKEGTLKALEELLVPVENALKEGIKSILDEFSPYLNELKFPPRIASRLQEVADWG